MIRDIVNIDEQLCDGCGQCVPACAEGALRIVNGKARLVADQLCDGLGACLGHCPRGVIRIVRRQAAVATAAPHHRQSQLPSASAPRASARPASRFARLRLPARKAAGPSQDADRQFCGSTSELTLWPVQLRLLPAQAPVLRRARLLLTADCVPVACPDFHHKMLRGRAVAVACPKLDQTDKYAAKLTEMIRANDLAELVVAHMEVPCCTGLLILAAEARRLSGKPLRLVQMTVSTQGDVITEREIPAEAA